MTQKEIFAIASTEYGMNIIKEIEEIKRNMCYKTIREQKTARAKMRRLAKELIEIIDD